MINQKYFIPWTIIVIQCQISIFTYSMQVFIELYICEVVWLNISILLMYVCVYYTFLLNY